MADGFHWRDGIYFKRLDDGSVRVQFFMSNSVGEAFDDDGDEPARELIIPANEWGSIVASVSAIGETSETYAAAVRFHDGPTKAAAPAAETKETR